MSSDDTAASEHGADAETTIVPPPAADEPDLAWSSDDDDTDESQTNRHGRLMWAGLSLLVAAVAAALILLVSNLFAHNHPNTVKPQPISQPPTATSAVAAAPAPPTATTPFVASAGPYASLVGKWTGHHRWLTVSADGTIELLIPDDPACPSCSAATMPFATIHIGLTSYDGTPAGTPDSSGKFFGYTKDSSDTRVIPVGVPVEVDVINASDYSYLGSPPDRTAPGRVVTVSINSDHVGAMSEGHQLGEAVPFCDAPSAHKSMCGA
jgi:hypothetical protein